MTIREEILFSLLVATAVVTGGELLWLRSTMFLDRRLDPAP
jgi:hypothetical protein